MVLMVGFQTFVVLPAGPALRWKPHERIPALSMRIALTRYLDITTPPGQQFLRVLATMAEDETDKRKIQLLATVM